MVAVNTPFQSGRYRAYIDWSPHSNSHKLFINDEDGYYITFKDGMLIMNSKTEGTMVGSDLAALEWMDRYEDQVVDMFKAVAKALEIYDDGPGQAYKQGLAEGKAEVYKEWNESLRASYGLRDNYVKPAA
jgi:hypothetical protein